MPKPPRARRAANRPAVPQQRGAGTPAEAPAAEVPGPAAPAAVPGAPPDGAPPDGAPPDGPGDVRLDDAPPDVRPADPRPPDAEPGDVGVPRGAAAGIERLLRRARWFAATLTAAQFLLYRAPAGSSLPFSRWWGAVPVAVMLALNLETLRRGRRGAPSGRWPVVQLVADGGVALGLVGMFAFDPSSALWVLLVLPVLEAAVRGWPRGALATFAVLSVGYVACETVAATALADGAVSLDSVTYRLGVAAVLTGCTAGLAARLSAQVHRTSAARAEVGQLRVIAAATRRMASLDLPTVIREFTDAAQDLGFSDVQLRTRGGALVGTDGGDPGPGAASGAWAAWFDRVTAAIGTAGYAVLDAGGPGDPPDAGGPLVVAPVAAGPDVEILLSARPPHGLEQRDAEALALLAAQAGAALANALRYQEGRALEERLAYQSTHDALTGLPNRALLRDRARTAVARSRRQSTLVAVMVIDIDRFQAVNDVLGHAIGDGLLRQVGERLTSDLRAEDTCARVGGDEFAVITGDHASVDAVLELARRLVSSLSEAFTVEGANVDIDASMGVAWAPDHGEDIDDLLRRADVAMSAAKERREGVVVYSSSDDHRTPAHVATLGDLRRALESEEQLTALYQPIVSVATERLVAVEALLRWQHPSRGQVSPAEFIPMAEGTSVIHQLTDHVLDLALACLSDWLEHGLDIHLAVNLSPQTLLDVSLCQRLESLLDHHGVAPDRLRLEITEGTLLADPTRAIATMHRLKELGLRLSIDDFGTGYASMTYLKSLPVDELKIDRTFVSDMVRSARDGAMVNSFIDLAHGLGLHVVAEGVEDQDTLDALCFVGCDLAQGYLVGRPMAADALLAWAIARGELDHRPDPLGPPIHT